MQMAKKIVVAMTLCTGSLIGCLPPQSVEEKPTPPDMKSIVSAFEQPTGSVNNERISDAIAKAKQMAKEIQHSSIEELIQDALDAVNDGLVDHTSNTLVRQCIDCEQSSTTPIQKATRTQSNSHGIQGGGWFEAERVCNGWGSAPTPEISNGIVRLNIGFSADGVDPVIWGTVRDCKYLVPSSPAPIKAMLDGGDDDVAVAVYLGEQGAWGQMAHASMIVRLKGSLTLDNESWGLDLAFSIVPAEKKLSVLVPVSDGVVVVEIQDDTIALDAKNGRWQCDLSEMQCKGPNQEILELDE